MTQNIFSTGMEVAQGLQGLQDQRYNSDMQKMQNDQAMQDREAQAANQQRIGEMKQAYADNGDPQVMRQIIAEDTELAGQLMQKFDLLDEGRKSQTINQAGSLKRMIEENPEQAGQYFQQNLANDPAFAELADNFAAGDYEGAINELGWGVTLAGGEEVYQSMFGDGVEGDAPSSVREWEYYNSLSDEDKQKYLNMKRSSQLYKQGDVTMQLDQVGGGGATVVEQGQDPINQAGQQAELTDQAATKAATIDAAKQSIAQSQDAFNKLGTIRTSTANLDEAIRLVDEGANTGFIMSKLPSVQSASIELDNLQGQLGLDVIGNTTFGALSEAELKFALDTALPRGLQEQDLKDWLQRKKDAQVKLSAYLEDAAIFLGTPGNTIADYLAEQKNNAASMTIESASSLDDLMKALDSGN